MIAGRFPFYGVPLLFLLGSSAVLQAQDELSPPLIGAVGDTSSVYTESATSGTLSTIAPGANDLTSSYNRTGITDPFRFLIESGTMSPYVQGAVDENLDAVAMTGTLNDPLIALQFGEYRNNSAQMTGVAPTSATRTGGVLSSNGTAAFSSPRQGNGTTAFDKAEKASAAGSSLDAEVKSAGNGAPDGLSQASGAPGSAGGVTPGPDGPVPLEPAGSVSGYGYGAGTGDDAASSSIAGSAAPDGESAMTVGSADTMPAGPAAGSTFPLLNTMTESSARFPDSTMGTAGSPAEVEGPGSSPLLSSIGEAEGSPFPSISAENTSFLHPGLSQPKPGLARSVQVTTEKSMHERAREAQLEDMVRHPGAPLPSAFAREKQERAYRDQQRGENRPQRAPSIVATPR